MSERTILVDRAKAQEAYEASVKAMKSIADGDLFSIARSLDALELVIDLLRPPDDGGVRRTGT